MSKRLAKTIYFLAYTILFFFNGFQFLSERLLNLSMIWKLLLYLIFWSAGFLLLKETLLKQLHDFFHRKRSLIYIVIGIFFLQLLGAIIFSMISDNLLTFFNLEQEFLVNDVRIQSVMTQVSPLLSLPILTFFGPMVEEIIFRIMIQDYLTEKLSFKLAIVIQAVLFGLLHLHTWNSAQFLLIFPHIGVGLVLGIIKNKYQNIWFTIFPHALNNLIALLGIL